MSLPVFPGELPGIAYPRDKEASFATLTQAAPNGLEVTVSQARNPIWKWTLTYEVLRDDPAATGELINGYTEYEILQGFQLAVAGSGGVFLLTDPKDNYIGPAVVGGVPNPQAQLQVVNDGAATPVYYSPVQRNFGGQFYEDITDINGTLQVCVNGLIKRAGVDYNLLGPGVAIPGYSFTGLVVQWITGAPAGPVTVDGHFYFRVRFAEDAQAFSRFLGKMWTIGGSDAGDSTNMVIKSARPVLA